MAYIKFDWLFGVWICVFKKYFLTQYKMALSSVISLDEMKSLVLTKRKTHQEISNILKKRHHDMRGLSAMNVRGFCNENGIRTRTTLDDSEIEKGVTKSITEVISKFLQNVGNKMLFYS